MLITVSNHNVEPKAVETRTRWIRLKMIGSGSSSTEMTANKRRAVSAAVIGTENTRGVSKGWSRFHQDSGIRVSADASTTTGGKTTNKKRKNAISQTRIWVDHIPIDKRSVLAERCADHSRIQRTGRASCHSRSASFRR